ncbi:MAG: hypothetical protein ACTSSA_08490 [Candidatus Freyarchaeota archaeon]
MDELARRLEALRFTDKSPKLSGEMIAELQRKKQIIGFRDAMIAGKVRENSFRRLKE